ncbi:uncharacterized protein V6R79_016586 [Siganus canaliculatus]
MKLILAFSLICTLTSAVGALWCNNNIGKRQQQQICLADEVCATISWSERTKTHISTTCLPSAVCSKQNELMSASHGPFYHKFVLQCCDTDGCNKDDVLYHPQNNCSGHFLFIMKLILTLSLICTLTSAVGALRCFDDNYNTQTCDADEVCATISSRSSLENQVEQFHVMRTCLPSTLCLKQNEVLSIRYLFDQNMFLQCCDTDFCNNQAGRHYSLQPGKENGLECFSCAGPLGTPCNTTVKCVGIQNRCVAATMHHDDNTISDLRGCASANVCETVSNFKGKSKNSIGVSKVSVEKCCGSSFCNSDWTVKRPDQVAEPDWTVKRPDQVAGAAWTVKMNFGALLLCLIVFVV